MPLWVGVDTGGTFTDVVVVDREGVRIAKVLSTPANPAHAVLAALRQVAGDGTPLVVTYGSTVATNTVLERRGARVTLFTTAGFEDVIAIGRQARPELYALEPQRPEPLVDRRDRRGVAERMAFDGKVLVPLTPGDITNAVARAHRAGTQAIAVCFLHAYLNPRHERQLANALRRAGFSCSVSHELCRRHGEYERFSTTVINAYVGPRMSRHLTELAAGLQRGVLRVMQSNGGAVGAHAAARAAVRTILSGPAAGVVGAVAVARNAGLRRVITLDMGGTSTDVSLVDGQPGRRGEYEIGGFPVLMPSLDIHTIGAGGGSLAYRDAGGALKVGPESAGADPGPACYGAGDRPTVTDANLFLGRLGDGVLAGGLRLDRGRARRVLARLGRALGLPVERAAEGIVKVVNAAMERAIRAVSVERGYDPRGYVLLAFGGAAGLHACELAASLGITRVMIPREPGVLSAWGAAIAEVARDYVQTVRIVQPDVAHLRRVERRLMAQARRDLAAEHVAARRIHMATVLAARYLGQSSEVEVPLERGYADRFHRAHRRLYGHADRDAPVEVVHVALHAVGHRRSTDTFPRRRAVTEPARTIAVVYGGRRRRAQLVARDALGAGDVLRGPAVISEHSATTFVPPSWQAALDRRGHLQVRRAR